MAHPVRILGVNVARLVEGQHALLQGQRNQTAHHLDETAARRWHCTRLVQVQTARQGRYNSLVGRAATLGPRVDDQRPATHTRPCVPSPGALPRHYEFVMFAAALGVHLPLRSDGACV